MQGSTSEMTVENVILRHSKRGMHILEGYLEKNYCEQAAEEILKLEKGTVFLTTGFYVAGYAETDGPLGTLFLAKALNRLGYRAVIVTDEFCRGYFETEGVETVYAAIDAGGKEYRALLREYRPLGLISIERCGENVEGDYANMRGVSIAGQTARIDRMFELAKEEGIPTFGVGDGGNEIGMGNLKQVITEKLELVPCRVTVDHLVIATVSNWGAYGIIAYLEMLTGEKLLPEVEQVETYLGKIVDMGSIDGVNKEHVPTVDGFPVEVEREILDGLHGVIASA